MRKLVTFVQAARARGVVEVNAIGSTYLPAWDAIAASVVPHGLGSGAVALPVLGGFQYYDYFYLERHFE